MEFTTHFELHSQTTRLFESVSHKASAVRVRDGILTLYDAPFQKTCTRSDAENTSPDYNSDGHSDRQILNLSFSRFTRSY
jgi:hypothetical protein